MGLDQVGRKDRLKTIDAVRGFAVMGILAMNIVGFGLPGNAYVNPAVAGGTHGADLWAWAFAEVFFDGKMRALFAMLFGASILLMAERNDSPGIVRRHLARMVVLLGIGMVHAWLIWSGDILVTYALVGMLVFPWRNLPVRRLFLLAVIGLALQVSVNVSAAIQGQHLERLVAAGRADASDREQLAALHDSTNTSPEDAAREVVEMRGDWHSVQSVRARSTRTMQTVIIPMLFVVETAALMLLGMALYRLGWWQGRMPPAAYRRMALLALPMLAMGAILPAVYAANGFRTVDFLWMDALRMVVGPVIAIGYSAALILLQHSGRLRWLTDRLAAAGQMALTNYLMTSILMTTLFYGTGFGLFGSLSRAQLWMPVLAMWALILLWSEPWLRHFVQGPFEWLWRSLARGKAQPFVRRQ